VTRDTRFDKDGSDGTTNVLHGMADNVRSAAA